MAHTALSSAHASVCRKVAELTCTSEHGSWRRARTVPEAALRLADSLDARIGALITGVSLLRHEAKAAIAGRKGCA